MAGVVAKQPNDREIVSAWFKPVAEGARGVSNPFFFQLVLDILINHLARSECTSGMARPTEYLGLARYN